MAPCLSHASLKPSLNIDFFFLLFLLRNSLHLFARPEVFVYLFLWTLKVLRGLALPTPCLIPTVSRTRGPARPACLAHSHQRARLLSADVFFSFLHLFSQFFSNTCAVLARSGGRPESIFPALLKATLSGQTLCSLPVSCCASHLNSLQTQGAASSRSPNVSSQKGTLWGPRPCMSNPEHLVVVSCNNSASPSNQIVCYYVNSESRKTKFQNVDLEEIFLMCMLLCLF